MLFNPEMIWPEEVMQHNEKQFLQLHIQYEVLCAN